MTFHILHSLTCIWYMYTVSAVIDQLLSAGVWFSLHRQVPSNEDSSLLGYGAMSNDNHRLFGAVSVSVFGVQSTLRCIPGGLNSHQYCGRNVRPHIVSIRPRQASQKTLCSVRIHSFRSLSYDRSIASSTASSPQSGIYCFLFKIQYSLVSLRRLRHLP